MVPGEQNPPAPFTPCLMLHIFNHVTHEMFETVELSHHSTCGTQEINDNSWCVCMYVYTIPDVLAVVYTGHFQISSLKDYQLEITCPVITKH